MNGKNRNGDCLYSACCGGVFAGGVSGGFGKADWVICVATGGADDCMGLGGGKGDPGGRGGRGGHGTDVEVVAIGAGRTVAAGMGAGVGCKV